MEALKQLIEFTTTTEACFIERSESLKRWNKTFIKFWLEDVNPQIEFENYMKTEVTLASKDEDYTWKAIRKADHIWCQTFFIGESAHLFARLLLRAAVEGVSNKVFFNLADRSDACRELSYAIPNAVRLIQVLKIKQNNQFFFFDDIVAMMHSPYCYRAHKLL